MMMIGFVVRSFVGAALTLNTIMAVFDSRYFRFVVCRGSAVNDCVAIDDDAMTTQSDAEETTQSGPGSYGSSVAT